MTQPAYDFQVSQAAVFTQIGDSMIPISGRKAVVRDDTGEPVAICGSRYAPVQHRTVIDLALQALDNLGLASTMNVRLAGTAGSKMFCHLRINEQALVVGDPKVNDLVALEVVAKNSLDGTSPVSIEICGRRLVCLNGLTVDAKLLKFRALHTKHLALGSMTSTIERAVLFFQTQAIPFWNRLASNPVSHEDGTSFITQLGERVLPNRYTELAQEQWDSVIERTAWGLLNSVTWVLTHKIEDKSYLRARSIGLAVEREFRSMTA